MADDDRRSEQFIREVHEEYRREQMSALWQRFGWLVIGVCVAIVVMTAGYRGWLWWQEREAARNGDMYLAALQQLETGDRTQGEAELKALIDSGSDGYRVLARLQLAAAQAESGEAAAAISSFDAIAKDDSAPQAIRSLAIIRAALLALDAGDAGGASDRASPLAIAGNPWRHVAREIIGMADYQKGDYDQARQAFAAIQEDAESSPTLRERANMMIALLDSQSATPAAAGEATEGAGAATPAATPPDTAAADEARPTGAQ